MAHPDTLVPAKPMLPPCLDLKWSLMLRVLAVALFCFFTASALAIYATHREVRKANEDVAENVGKLLELQLFRIGSNFDVPARFPDWDPVAYHLQGGGQCLRYVKADGKSERSDCVGFGRDRGAPYWFSSLASGLFAGRADVERTISYHRKVHGTLFVTTEPEAVAAAVWMSVSGLLGLTALTILAICALVYVAISRALNPTKDVLAGLDRLAQGDLACRLPQFRLSELQRISDVFNILAESLDRTTRERAALAGKLVDAHEQERLYLARELHDELAQSLSAIAAIAASIKATAEAQSPSLVPEARRLSQTSIEVMKSLRMTLRNLRPQEIDDLGLAPSLDALVASHERRAGGGQRVQLKITGDIASLPPTASAHVYRIVQEGLTNISKHAGAREARVAIDFRPPVTDHAAPPRRRWLELTIEDDGRGARAPGRMQQDTGFGLVGMRERVMALGGHLDVTAEGERGFKLHAKIPFSPSPETQY